VTATTADLLRAAATVIDERRAEHTPVTAIRIAAYQALGATPQARELGDEAIVALAVAARYGIDPDMTDKVGYAERLLNRWEQLYYREDVAAELRKAADRIEEKATAAPGVSVRGGPDLDPATETEYRREQADDVDGDR
jgi:hypothetical protein